MAAAAPSLSELGGVGLRLSVLLRGRRPRGHTTHMCLQPISPPAPASHSPAAVLQQVYDAIELVPMLDRLAAAGVRRCDINSSYLANVERAGGPTLALAKAAYDLISRVPVAAEQWCAQGCMVLCARCAFALRVVG